MPDSTTRTDAGNGSFATARKAMLDSQLRPSGVNAPFVLERMGSVAREDFVPQSARGFAYMDRAIALGDGGFLASPLVQGLMLQEAAPTTADMVLLVDSGSGYLAALLRPLAGTLTVISPADAADDKRVGKLAGKGNTLLIIDGAVEQVPAKLLAALEDNARIITGLQVNGITRLALGKKLGKQIAWLPLADLGMPALPQFAAPKAWSF